MDQSETDVRERRKVLSAWVHQYGDQLYSWAYHKTSQQATAEDLVQETFMAALKSFDKFRNQSDPKTWLFSILNNKIVDHYRKSAQLKTTSFELIWENNDPTYTSPFDAAGQWVKERQPREWSHTEGNIFDNKDFEEVFYKCMDDIPVNWRACLQLKYLSGKKSKKICQDLNITPSNFWQILHRARLQLRECLEKLWFKL